MRVFICLGAAHIELPEDIAHQEVRALTLRYLQVLSIPSIY